MSETNTNERLEAEIKELQERLTAKQKEYGQETHTNERELFREIFRERMDELAMSAKTNVSAPAEPSVSTNGAGQNAVKDIQKEEEVKALLYIAFEKSPEDAIRAAQASGNAYLLDELHDRLADQYYDKLLEFRKIKAF